MTKAPCCTHGPSADEPVVLPAEQTEEDPPSAGAASWQDEDVAATRESNAAPAAAPPDPTAREKAKKHMFRYVKFVIADVLDVASLEQALTGNLI